MHETYVSYEHCKERIKDAIIECNTVTITIKLIRAIFQKI